MQQQCPSQHDLNGTNNSTGQKSACKHTPNSHALGKNGLGSLDGGGSLTAKPKSDSLLQPLYPQSSGLSRALAQLAAKVLEVAL